MVWVCPGILPATIKVAPNSPKARAKDKTIPAIIPLLAKGKLIRQKIDHSEAPKVLATCKSFLSICSNAPKDVLYINGKATTVAVIIAAYQVKTILMLSGISIFPITPFLPNSSSNKKPTTVGGKIKGEINIPSIIDFHFP